MYVKKNGKWIETLNGLQVRTIEFNGVCCEQFNCQTPISFRDSTVKQVVPYRGSIVFDRAYVSTAILVASIYTERSF